MIGAAAGLIKNKPLKQDKAYLLRYCPNIFTLPLPCGKIMSTDPQLLNPTPLW
jgi:hypothetical protein